MSKPTDLLTALTLLRSLIQSDNPPMDYNGICPWLIHNAVVPTHAFMDLYHQWPKCVMYRGTDGTLHKGRVFPIIDHSEYTKAYSTNTQWSNPTRLEFIDWAIEHLSKEQFK